MPSADGREGSSVARLGGEAIVTIAVYGVANCLARVETAAHVAVVEPFRGG
jgi:hypothetical protein